MTDQCRGPDIQILGVSLQFWGQNHPDTSSFSCQSVLAADWGVTWLVAGMPMCELSVKSLWYGGLDPGVSFPRECGGCETRLCDLISEATQHYSCSLSSTKVQVEEAYTLSFTGEIPRSRGKRSMWHKGQYCYSYVWKNIITHAFLACVTQWLVYPNQQPSSQRLFLYWP